ncbi:MAG: hypothetical protein ACKD6O_08135 [Candidatus Bathyarchaeota archaeon]
MKKTLTLILVFTCFFLLVSNVYASSSIDLTNNPFAVLDPYQRKTFISTFGQVWVFYPKPSDYIFIPYYYVTEIAYRYSSNGVNWFEPVDHKPLNVDGDGYYQQWTLVGASSHSQAVQSNDGDNSYVVCVNNNYLESFSVADVVSAKTNAYALMVKYTARLNASGQYGFVPIVRVNNVVYEWEGSVGTLTTTYANYTALWAKNPATGKAWTVQDLANVEVGMRYTSGTAATGYQVRVTYIYVEAVHNFIIEFGSYEQDFSVAYDSSSNRVYVVYQYAGKLYCRIGTVSLNNINFTEYLITESKLTIKYCHKGIIRANLLYFMPVHKMRVALWSNVSTGTSCLIGDQCGLTGQVWSQYPDGKVDMKDVAYVSKYFGVYPVDYASVMADVYSDNKIDTRDVAYPSRYFGCYGSYYNGSAVKGVKVKFNSLSYNITLDETGWCDVPANATSYTLYNPEPFTNIIYAMCEFYVLTEEPILNIQRLNVQVDSYGYPYVTYNVWNNTHQILYVIKSSSTSQWLTANGYPKKLSVTLSSSVSQNFYCSSINRLNNGDVYVVYSVYNGFLKARLYNKTLDSWLNEESLTNKRLTKHYFSTVSFNSKVHVAFLCNESNVYNIAHLTKTNSEWLFSYVRLNVASNSNPQLSFYGNILVCFHALQGSNVYVQTSNDNGYSWSTPTLFLSDILGRNDRISCSLEGFNSKIAFIYMNRTASPYIIKFEYFNVPSKVWRDISIWLFSLAVKVWRNICIETFNLLANTWRNISIWFFSLTVRIWRDICETFFSLVVKAWNDIAYVVFNLATSIWHNINCWLLQILTGGWHTVSTLNFNVKPLRLYLLVSLFLLICFLFTLVFEEENRRKREV